MDFKSCFSHFEARLCRCWKTVSSLAACMQISSGAQPGSSHAAAAAAAAGNVSYEYSKSEES